jgi:hypothetical protein
MKRFFAFVALAAWFTFAVGTIPAFASDPSPAPTQEKDKKSPSGPKFNAGDEKKDEKKDDKKGGK